MKKQHLFLIIFSFFSFFAYSQSDFDFDNPTEPYLNTVTTAAPFLLISPDARSGGMGDLGVATSPDNYSQHHNPSKYVFNKEIFGIGIAYSPWLSNLVNDVHLAYLAGYGKVTENDAIAVSLRYFSLGDIQFTDREGNPIGSPRNPHEFSLDFTYSRKLSNIVSMAVTPRFVYSNLSAGFYEANSAVEMKAGVAGAVDISLFVDKEFIHYKSEIKSSELMFGANISNIGNKISYVEGADRADFLPCNLRLGLSYVINFDDYNTLAMNVETHKLLVPTPPISYRDTTTNDPVFYGNGKNINDINPIAGIGRSFYDAAGGYKENPAGCFKEEMREVNWAFGFEYSYRNILFVRTGAFLESKWKGARKFATVGVGVKYNIFAIDVSYLFALTDMKHPLENTLRFSLTFLLESFNKDQIKNQGRFN